jgi:hypothetical protein
VSSTQLTAQILASDAQTAGTFPVTVFNPAPGGGTSGPVTLRVNNPAPSLSSISPPSVQAGSAAFTLTVNGSNFVNGSAVSVNGVSRTTTFVSSTQLTAQILASDVQTAGTFPVTVFSAAPGGGTSASATLTASNPLPALSSVSPLSVQAGSAAFTITVNGSNFVAGSVVRFNDQNRQTTLVSSVQMTAQILASDVQTAGTFPVTVFTPGPGGGVSNLQNFTVAFNLAPLVLKKTLGTLRNDLYGYFGMKITVGIKPIVVRSLGRVIVSGNSDQHTLKIVDATNGAEVATVILSMMPTDARASNGQFKYAELARPVTLKAGSSYYLVSEEINKDWWYDSDTSLTIADVATIDGPVSQEGKDEGWTVLKSGSSFVPVDLIYERATQ